MTKVAMFREEKPDPYQLWNNDRQFVSKLHEPFVMR